MKYFQDRTISTKTNSLEHGIVVQSFTAQIFGNTADKPTESTVTQKHAIANTTTPDCKCTLSRNEQYQKLGPTSLPPEQCIALLSALAKQNKVP